MLFFCVMGGSKVYKHMRYVINVWPPLLHQALTILPAPTDPLPPSNHTNHLISLIVNRSLCEREEGCRNGLKRWVGRKWWTTEVTGWGCWWGGSGGPRKWRAEEVSGEEEVDHGCDELKWVVRKGGRGQGARKIQLKWNSIVLITENTREMFVVRC